MVGMVQAGRDYDLYVVLLHSDERFLMRADCEDWLKDYAFGPDQSIDEAFLLFPYVPPDERYFIDRHVYNCPFCNRRHVAYRLVGSRAFNWDTTNRCNAVFVACQSCERESRHLTFENVVNTAGRIWAFRSDVDIDEAIFHSIPSSFHTIDDRIPKNLRDLLSEAEGCLKSNFLTGASACARKLVYELAVKHEAEEGHWKERLKSLKATLPDVDPTYFDTLVTAQELTSEKVHEEAYDGWKSEHLRVILGALRKVLREVYVLPAERQKSRDEILALKMALLEGKKISSTDATTPAESEETDTEI